jgi:Right handed beta helix region
MAAWIVRKIAFPPIVLTATLVCLLPAAPAQAQAARTFVSAAGSDSNNCINVATPCRHFAAAYAATAPNGEIYVLDPANYGALTITGPVSIEGHGWASVAPAANSVAISVNAEFQDKINIIGVVLDGTALAGTTGIQFNFGGSLTIRDCVIRNFGDYGLRLTSSFTASRQVFVSNTLISDNGSHGVYSELGGSGTMNAIFDHVYVQNNGGNGIWFQALFGPANVTIIDTVVANNTICGIAAASNTPATSVMVRNSTIVNNGGAGLEADADEATIRVTRSTISGNNTAWYTDLGGVVLSYGDNNIDGNTNANTEPPNPLIYK